MAKAGCTKGQIEILQTSVVITGDNYSNALCIPLSLNALYLASV